MATYHAHFLSRDEQGQFKQRTEKMGGITRHADMLAYINHGWEHDKWHLEGPITVVGPIGHRSCETKQYS